MKVTYYAAMSRDGFIARENGDVSWLDDLNIDYSSTGYEEFFASIDGLVMGRKSYDFVFDYGSWPYEDKLTWVCTNRSLQVLDGANLIVTRSPEEVCGQAKDLGLNHLWLVGGGRLASSFIDAGLLTHLSLSEMPVELGSGIPLFSRHRLADLAASQRRLDHKGGFTQYEAELTHNGMS